MGAHLEFRSLFRKRSAFSRPCIWSRDRISIHCSLLRQLHRFLGAIVLFHLLIAVAVAQASEPEQIRIGVLKFGTVNWELNVIQHHELTEREGVSLQIVPLASKSATQVAIQGGAVDVMVSDWVWVSRQRASGRDYTFVPYSTAVGALMVVPDAGIQQLEDLEGKRLGIAGGPVDKSWLLLRAYSHHELGKDIKDLVTPNFAAPPLLNELALRGELPAVLNFWHYSARLKAAGLRPLLPVKDLLPALGVKEPVPLIGWIFTEQWAEEHLNAVIVFLNASYAAKKILAESDTEWERLRPMLKVTKEDELVALREAYRAGIPGCFGTQELEAAKQLYAILAREGGRELVGSSQTLADGTFWSGFKAASCQR